MMIARARARRTIRQMKFPGPLRSHKIVLVSARSQFSDHGRFSERQLRKPRRTTKKDEGRTQAGRTDGAARGCAGR